MKVRSSRAAVVVAAAFVVGACGDSTGPTSNLTQAESMAVFNEVLAAIFAVGLGGGGSPEASATYAVAADRMLALAAEVIDETVPCEGGGSIRVHGSITDQTDANGVGSFDFSLTETPNNCGVVTESGRTYRVNGNPNIHMTGAMSFDEEGPTGPFTMSFHGGLAWTATSGGSGSGSCSINLDYTIDMTTFQGTVVGGICGHAVNQTF